MSTNRAYMQEGSIGATESQPSLRTTSITSPQYNITPTYVAK